MMEVLTTSNSFGSISNIKWYLTLKEFVTDGKSTLDFDKIITKSILDIIIKLLEHNSFADNEKERYVS